MGAATKGCITRCTYLAKGSMKRIRQLKTLMRYRVVEVLVVLETVEATAAAPDLSTGTYVLSNYHVTTPLLKSTQSIFSNKHTCVSVRIIIAIVKQEYIEKKEHTLNIKMTIMRDRSRIGHSSTNNTQCTGGGIFNHFIKWHPLQKLHY